MAGKPNPKVAIAAFRAQLDEQRWDDHRYYHHCLINQSLHFLSASSFIAAYVLLFNDPALASLLGGFGFAALYNSSSRTVLVVGILSLAGNDLRLALHDFGMPLPPATFFGALAVGLLASIAQTLLKEPRIILTVPAIIIMTPGLYAFQTIVMLNQGDVLAAIQAGAMCCFVVGAMAMGLAAARFMTERRWLIER